MRNRWFHPPELHSPGHGDEKRVGWLELFYDLIFVAAFIQLGNGLSQNASLEGVTKFGALFVPLWIAWTGFTYYENRYNIDDFAHRLLVFVKMFTVGAMAISASGVFAGDDSSFALAYGAAQWVIAIMYARAFLQEPRGKAFSRYWGVVFGLGGTAFIISTVLPPTLRYGLWSLGVLVVLAAPISKQSRALMEELPIDTEHLTERYGLLTIIVLGESFVKVLSSLVDTGDGASFTMLMQASFTLLITCCLWWIYFDDVAGSAIRQTQGAGIVWLYAHIPLQAGITATGVAIKKALFFDLTLPAPDGYRWLLAGTLATTLMSVALIDSVTERRQAELSDRVRVNVRVGSALGIVLLGAAGHTMTSFMFIAFLAALCVAQVIFDMMMAPLEATPVHHHVTTTAELSRQARSSGRPVPRPKALARAVRQGTPSELRRDLYLFFLDGPWVRLGIALTFVYMLTNVCFAALYMLEPGCISGTETDSFTDAFFFSVQTMSTIGYGAFSPATDYAHTIVTIQAALSLTGVAVSTGLILAKVGRPQSGVLFSERIVIAERNGHRTLSLRMANAKGTEIVEASATLTALIDEISAEGEHMRVLHDLPLVRARSPLFNLTWTAMHVIDESSPLNGIDWERGADHVVFLVASLVGHDTTYGQTTHGRHYYAPGDVHEKARFVDVLGQLPDGRMVIDYSRFHDIETVKDA